MNATPVMPLYAQAKTVVSSLTKKAWMERLGDTTDLRLHKLEGLALFV